MFFTKRSPQATATTHKVALNLNFNKGKGDFLAQKNVRLVGNGLTSTFGIVGRNFTDVSRVAFGKNGYLIMAVPGYGIFSCKDGGSVTYLLPLKADCNISHVEYRGSTVFNGESGVFTTDNGINLTKISNRYNPSLAVCNDRLFGLDGNNKLRMTAPGDISALNDSLSIDAHTQLDALVTLDKLFVLGDTCYSLNPDAEEINMKFAPVAYNIGKVVTESVVAMEKRAIFASTNGLYELKNGNVTPIFPQLNDYVSFEGSAACLYRGKYMITCRRKDGDGTSNDILLELDIDSEDISAVVDVCAQHISVIDGNLYLVVNSEASIADDGEATDSSFCQTVDFNCSAVKYLDKLAIRTLTDVEVWIDNGSEKRRYLVKGKDSIQRLPIVGKGRQFTVTVTSHRGMKLDYIELTAHSYEV